MKPKKKLDKVSVVFLQMAMLFVTVLVASNIFETKQIAVGPVNLTGGLLVFPLSYIICDCVCEVWGIRKLKSYEGEDVYDRDISYGIFEVFKRG